MKVWYPGRGVPHAEYGVGSHDVVRFSSAGKRSVYVVLMRDQAGIRYVLRRWDAQHEREMIVTKPMSYDDAFALGRELLDGGPVPEPVRL